MEWTMERVMEWARERGGVSPVGYISPLFAKLCCRWILGLRRVRDRELGSYRMYEETATAKRWISVSHRIREGKALACLQD